MNWPIVQYSVVTLHTLSAGDCPGKKTPGGRISVSSAGRRPLSGLSPGQSATVREESHG